MLLFLMYRTAVDLEADARPGDQVTISSTEVQILTYQYKSTNTDANARPPGVLQHCVRRIEAAAAWRAGGAVRTFLALPVQRYKR
jgi:hypothetical protein